MVLSNASLLAKLGFIAIFSGLILLILGYYSIKKMNYKNHKYFMYLAVILDTVFLVLYITRYLIEGNVVFGGSKFLFRYIYVPILSIHILAAIISIFFVLRQVKTGYLGQSITNQGTLVLMQPHKDSHKKYGRIAVYIWGSSFVGGIIIFILLYII